jgi:hypothetical protein
MSDEYVKTKEKVKDILKRLDIIENCLLKLTPVIDMAREYEDRVKHIELQIYCQETNLKMMSDSIDERIGKTEPDFNEKAKNIRNNLCFLLFLLFLAIFHFYAQH